MRIQTLVLLVLFLAGPALAAQHWGCTRGTTWSGEIKPVLWLNVTSQNTGTVQMDGGEVKTTYAQTGLNRTWYWGENDKGFYVHSVSLRGDGVALYFDFTYADPGGEEEGRALPQYFTCREFSPKSKQEIEGLTECSEDSYPLLLPK